MALKRCASLVVALVIAALTATQAVAESSASPAVPDDHCPGQASGELPGHAAEPVASDLGPVLDEPVRLRDVARDGLLVGGAASRYDANWYRGGYAALANRQFNAMTSMTYMAYNGWLNPAEPIDTSGHRKMVKWATRSGKQVHGHVLVYPLANRDLAWFQNPAIDHEAALESYVTCMAASAAGEVWVWDVVNEVLADPGDGRVDEWGLRTDYIEYTEIGPDYVDKAFAWARAADPDAALIINDYGAEAVNDKSDRLLDYVIELRRRGVPIDGVGFQMHIIGTFEPDYQSIEDNFARFAAAGFDLYITEMDVSAVLAASEFPLPDDEALARQRRIYERIARIATEQPAVKSLLLWDYADQRSWLNPTDRWLGDVPPGTWTYPTPFTGGDTELPTPKPAFFGLVDGLTVDGGLAPGRYRVRAGWGSGQLTRFGVPNGSGGFDPSNQVRLQGINPAWSSQMWTVEAAEGGSVRIVNEWDPGSGQLSRVTSSTGAATNKVRLERLDVAAPAQRWIAEPAGDGAYRLRSSLGGETGYLTRRGKLQPDGTTYRPTNKVELHPLNPEWTSQLWYFEPID